jgi:hypothetical protein
MTKNVYNSTLFYFVNLRRNNIKTNKNIILFAGKECMKYAVELQLPSYYI